MNKVAIALMSALSASAAQAGTVLQFSDVGAFSTAVGAHAVEDFGSESHFPIPSGVLDQFTSEAGISPGLIEAGVQFSTTVGSENFFNIDLGGGYSGGFLDSLASPVTHELTIDFDGTVDAFGFLANGLMGAFDVTLAFTGGSSSTYSYPQASALTFFGFQSDAPDIESVVVAGSTVFNFALDDFRFTAPVSAAAVPVPAGLPLALGALGALVLMRRRRR